MKTSFIKANLRAEIAARTASSFGLRDKPLTAMSSGIDEIDSLTGGIPRGAITEIVGPVCSGRTSLLLSALAAATSRQEACALVDASDSLDLSSGAEAGVDFNRLLWVRCQGNIGHSVKSTELLLQSGGFGLVALDLGDIMIPEARRIPANCWFRFRRAVENTATALVLIEQEASARTCSSLILDMDKDAVAWSGQRAPSHANLLGSVKFKVKQRKPASAGQKETCFQTVVSYKPV